MAQFELRVCDYPSGKTSCGQEAVSFYIWKDGARQAVSVDLCEKHAERLEHIIEVGEPVDVPARPRAKMELTKLRTTPATRKLKKRP